MINKKQKVIVTGGAGFIGSHLTRKLCDDGFEVFVVDNLVTGKKKDVDKRAKLCVADITDFKKITNLWKKVKPEYVFHLACLPRVQFSIDFPKETNDTNVTGTLNILIASRDSGVKRVIFSDSSSIYGDQPTLPFVETMKVDPKSPYGLQKYFGELYMKMFSTIYKLETVSLCYFNVYGPNQDPTGGYAQAIPKFIAQKKSGKFLTVTGDGEQRRDNTHVSDVVAANIQAMKSLKVGRGERINIGSGKNSSVNEIAKLIGGDIEYIPARLEPRETLAGIALAKKLIDWEPKVSLEEGIAELKKLNGI